VQTFKLVLAREMTRTMLRRYFYQWQSVLLVLKTKK